MLVDYFQRGPLHEGREHRVKGPCCCSWLSFLWERVRNEISHSGDDAETLIKDVEKQVNTSPGPISVPGTWWVLSTVDGGSK